MVTVSYPVTLIPGDGIGPEVADATMRAVDATGAEIDWRRIDLNSEIIAKTGQVLPQNVIDSLDETRVGLKGPVTTPIAGGFPSVNVALRKRLDLFANVRPINSLPGLRTRFDDVKIDMVIFRENTEDLYSGLEHEVVKDVVTKGIANPTVLSLSAVMMLTHLGEREAAGKLRRAIETVYAQHDHLTPDVGGQASTTEFTDAVIRNVQKK